MHRRRLTAQLRSVQSRILAAPAAVVLLAGCGAPNMHGSTSSSTPPSGSSTLASSVAKDAADGWTFHDKLAEYAYPSASDATLDSGDLTIAPHVGDPKSCARLFHGGEVVDISGDGFAHAATVELMLGLGRTGSATRTVQADQDGNIAVTLTLPANLPGLSFGGTIAGYLEANGDGSDSTTRSDNNLFGIGTADATCGATPSITLILMGPFEPKISTAGAVFAVTGPGLPPLARPSRSRAFAELDTDADGGATCPPREPSGVTCKDGELGPLEANATYTVTQISAPPNLAIAPPQTLTADDGIDGPDNMAFFDDYAGPALPARARVNLLSAQGRPLTGPAVFALTGPGLPSLSARPTPGSFAEVDILANRWTDCPAQEPGGVECTTGVIENLQPNTPYVMTELTAPDGYAVAAAQQFMTSSNGRVDVVQFVNDPISPTQTPG